MTFKLCLIVVKSMKKHKIGSEKIYLKKTKSKIKRSITRFYFKVLYSKNCLKHSNYW